MSIKTIKLTNNNTYESVIKNNVDFKIVKKKTTIITLTHEEKKSEFILENNWVEKTRAYLPQNIIDLTANEFYFKNNIKVKIKEIYENTSMTTKQKEKLYKELNLGGELLIYGIQELVNIISISGILFLEKSIKSSMYLEMFVNNTEFYNQPQNLLN